MKTRLNNLLLLLAACLCDVTRGGGGGPTPHSGGLRHLSGFQRDMINSMTKSANDVKPLAEDAKFLLLDKLVPKMDYNKDDTVDSDELVKFIEDVFRLLDRHEGQVKFNEYDIDEDGLVTLPEIVFVLYKINPEDLENLSQAEMEGDMIQLSINHDKAIFAIVDDNKDGGLDEVEFSLFYDAFKRLTVPEPGEETPITDLTGHVVWDHIPAARSNLANLEARALLLEVDTDKNNALTKDEILSRIELFSGYNLERLHDEL